VKVSTDMYNMASAGADLLELNNVSTKFKLPIEVQHKAELIDSNSAEHAVIDSSVLSYEYEHKHAMEEDSITLDYSDFVLSMRQQCVTIKYHVAYKTCVTIKYHVAYMSIFGTTR
jgi:hypothetical protein